MFNFEGDYTPYLATCRQTIPLWLRYVDDTFTAVHKDEIDEFHHHLNEQNADIQFTKEIEGKLPFLEQIICGIIRGLLTQRDGYFVLF